MQRDSEQDGSGPAAAPPFPFFFDFDFAEIAARSPGKDDSGLREKLARRKKQERDVLGIQRHDRFRALGKKRLRELLQTARDRIKVGFEIEFNGVSYPDAAAQLKEMGIITDVKSALKTTYTSREFFSNDTPANTKITVQIPQTVDMFKEHELIAYAYNDGSVPLEIVTTAYDLNLFELESNLRKIHNLVRKINGNATCNCLRNCGLHQTFSLAHRKDSFDKVIIANIFQICRAFSSGILWLFSSGNTVKRTRELGCRYLNNSVWKRPSVRTGKYSFVNNKNCELLEFRWVDGCNSPFLSALAALLNYSIIKKAIRLSEFGVLIIDTYFFRKNNASTTEFAEEKEIDEKFIAFNARKLLSFLEKELRECGIYEYLQYLLMNPVWKRNFDRDSIRSWKEQEYRIKAACHDKKEDTADELAALLSRTHAFDGGGM